MQFLLKQFYHHAPPTKILNAEQLRYRGMNVNQRSWGIDFYIAFKVGATREKEYFSTTLAIVTVMIEAGGMSSVIVGYYECCFS